MAARNDIPAALARSWLLVAATRPEEFEAASGSRADQLVLDIEDAVDPAAKPKARADVLEWLRGGGRAWVRINDRSTDFWCGDVDELAGAPGLLGVMLAKTESALHVTETFDRLRGAYPVIHSWSLRSASRSRSPSLALGGQRAWRSAVATTGAIPVRLRTTWPCCIRAPGW